MKIDTQLIPEPLVQVGNSLKRQNIEVRPVGGCVRDALLGRRPKDWDCAISSPPELTLSLLENLGLRPFDISNGHGTVSFIVDEETYELTSLRVDKNTDGRHAEVEFVSDFRLDAARRDFTVNALSCDIETGEVFDYFGGIQDLKERRLRFVGQPEKRIEEDYLRMLRYFRFLGKLNAFENFDQTSFRAISNNATNINKVSGERIWMEIQQIMEDPQVDKIMDAMKRSGVARQLDLI